MKKIVFTVLILMVIALIATCPTKQAHTEAVMNAVNSVLSKRTDDTDGWELLGAMLGSKIANVVVEQKLEVKDYFIFSIGQMTFNGETKTVSVGLFNHVFTFDKEDMTESL